MREQVGRELLCEIGRRSYERGLLVAADGNLSCRLENGQILMTPTGVCKGFLKPQDLVRVDIEGNMVDVGKRVTSEIAMHLAFYRLRPDVGGVVHTHPPYATAFALLEREVPNGLLQEVELVLGEIPIAPYARTGTQEFADALMPLIPDFQVFLLRNHGAVTAGADPLMAFYRLETLEHYCRIISLAEQMGPLRRLTDAQVQELLDLKAQLGWPDRRNTA